MPSADPPSDAAYGLICPCVSTAERTQRDEATIWSYSSLAARSNDSRCGYWPVGWAPRGGADGRGTKEVDAMTWVSCSVVVDGDPATVFDYVCDPKESRRWQRDLIHRAPAMPQSGHLTWHEV